MKLVGVNSDITNSIQNYVIDIPIKNCINE